MAQVIDKAVAWLIDLATDNSHGYSQSNRWGPDYDCSSSTIQAFREAGLKLDGATYTGNMKNVFINEGFKAIRYSKNIVPQKGDIFLNELHHVVVYIGEGKVVTASSSETGGKTGKTGDQTGKEIYIRDFYIPKNYMWDYILRYVEDEDISTSNPYKEPTSLLSIGSTGVGCYWLQWELNEAGASLQLDGDFGKLTKQSLMDFQKAVGIEVDGILGPISRQKLKENKSKVIGVKPKNPYSHNNKLILKKGSKNESVKWLQWELNQRGNYGLAIDGSFGPATSKALADWQSKNGLVADSICGPKTFAKLEN